MSVLMRLMSVKVEARELCKVRVYLLRIDYVFRVESLIKRSKFLESVPKVLYDRQPQLPLIS